ncbi:MAG: hypothetical protein WD398_05575 [Cyclobacteriaceae bacterium]
MEKLLNTPKFHALYTRFDDQSKTYKLNEWSSPGMDANKLMDVLDLIPERIQYHSLEKRVLSSAGIARGAAVFITTIEKISPEGWGKGTCPFIASARIHVEVWVKLCPDGEKIEIWFIPEPFPNQDSMMMYLRG